MTIINGEKDGCPGSGLAAGVDDKTGLTCLAMDWGGSRVSKPRPKRPVTSGKARVSEQVSE